MAAALHRALVASTMAWVALVVPASAVRTSFASGSADATLASKLSTAGSAAEYWDVTAWFDTGERFFARFLVTNQGPGERTAAAVGHLVSDEGRIVPFKWGRRSDAWTLGAGGQRLSIGKATLDVSAAAITVRIDSKKHGIDLALEIAQPIGPVVIDDLATPYQLAVAMPADARGTLNADDPSKARALVGSAAVVHTWGDRPESESIRRRDELLARRGDVALYVSRLTLLDGTRRTMLHARREREVVPSVGPRTLELGGTSAGDDAGYSMGTKWKGGDARVRFQATLVRERLRLNPLDVLPQPFRFLMSLGGTPRRVWADATVQLELTGGEAAPAAELKGIAVSSFARPER